MTGKEIAAQRLAGWRALQEIARAYLLLTTGNPLRMEIVAAAVALVPVKTCAGCGVPFVPSDGRQSRFCSARCTWRTAQRERRKRSACLQGKQAPIAKVRYPLARRSKPPGICRNAIMTSREQG